MVQAVGDTPVLENASLLEECVVETLDPDLPNQRWVWLVQLLEGLSPRNDMVVLRAQARKLGRRCDMRQGASLYFLEHVDKHFHLDLNAVELAINPNAEDKARLAARHDIIIHPRGTGLGRVLMSMVIRRAKERFPERAIAPATLGIADALTDEDRDRRNHFYERHGFRCDFPQDPERRVGFVHAKRIGDLLEHTNPSKVTRLSADQLFTELVTLRDKHTKAESRASSLQASLETLRTYFLKTQRKERWIWICVTCGLLTCLLVERLVWK